MPQRVRAIHQRRVDFARALGRRTFSAVARASCKARSGIAATIFCSAVRASRRKSTCSLRLSATATAAASRGVKFSGGRLIERSSA
jgi:hypothetical protein